MKVIKILIQFKVESNHPNKFFLLRHFHPLLNQKSSFLLKKHFIHKYLYKLNRTFKTLNNYNNNNSNSKFHLNLLKISNFCNKVYRIWISMVDIINRMFNLIHQWLTNTPKTLIWDLIQFLQISKIKIYHLFLTLTQLMIVITLIVSDKILIITIITVLTLISALWPITRLWTIWIILHIIPLSISNHII
jgi:hypothetical protein